MATIFSERMFHGWESQLGECADQVGVSRDVFRCTDYEYDIELYYRFLEAAARDVNPAIGLAIGSRMRLGDIGVLSHAAAASPTLGSALELLSRFLYVLAHGNSIRMDLTPRRAAVNYFLKDEFKALHNQDIELATSHIAKLVRDISGRQINPSLVELERSRPDYHKDLQSFFGCDVRYRASGNRLHYPREFLEIPLVSSDPSLLEALNYFLVERLKLRDEDEDLVARVNHLISANLGADSLDIAQIAVLLGLGRRTLQRRLAAHDLVFSEMVENARKTIAVDYMRGDEYSLTEVAYMLGYSELSAFSRAFRRWTGMSPQDYRTDNLNTEVAISVAPTKS